MQGLQVKYHNHVNLINLISTDQSEQAAVILSKDSIHEDDQLKTLSTADFVTIWD